MKKIAFVLVCLLSMTLHGNTAVVISKNDPPTVQLYPIGQGVQLSYEQLLSLTPKAYRELTGQRLGLFKSLALKTIQKKLRRSAPFRAQGQSQLIAAILVIFIGTLGVHRFYLGYTWQGIVQLFTIGGLGIWWLVDMIRIITGDLKPKDGEYAETL